MTIAAAQAGTAAKAAAPKGELFATTVCPWTPRNPRHDHAQIFPLSKDRLMLVWSEYYVRNPSRIVRTNAYSAGGSGDEAPCQLSGKISTDRGRTWSETFTVQENVAADCVKHPSLLRLASGEVLLFFTVRNFKIHESKIFMRRSKDECESWSKMEQVTPDGGFWLTNCDRAMLHSSGRVILPVYWSPTIWDAREHFMAFCLYSDDHGATWKQSRNRIDLPKRGSEEPGMIELKDGSIYTILRTSLGKIHSAVSRDRGETWSKAEPTSLTAPASQPCLRKMPGTETLVTLFNHNYEPGEGHGGVRNPLNSAISRDGGQSWENIKTIENRTGYDSAYPSLTFHGNEALITYYQRARAMSRDTYLELKIYPAEWFTS